MADLFKDLEADKQFERAKRQVERTKEVLEAQGAEVPEAQSGLLSKAVDVLDYSGALVRGAVFKALGVEGYSDKTFMDAALKNTGEDKLYTADALAKSGILSGKDTLTSVARGMVGFAGDVLLDPLSWLSPLGSAGGKKVGGKVLSEGGEAALASLKASKIKNKLSAVDDFIKNQNGSAIDIDQIKSLEDKLGRRVIIDPAQKPSELRQLLSEQADTTAGVEAAQDLKSTIDIRKRIDDVEANSAISDINKEKVLSPLKLQENRLKEKLGLAPNQPTSDLFRKPQIRFSSPLAGLFPNNSTWANIPILSTHNGTIPVVSEASEALYEMLSGPLYNARVKVGQYTEKGLKAMEDAGGTAAFVASTLRAVGETPKLFSRTLKAGGKQKAADLEQHTVARMIAKKTADDAQEIKLAKFKHLASELEKRNPKFNFDYFDQDMARQMELLNTKEPLDNIRTRGKLREHKITNTKSLTFEQVVEGTRAKYNAIDPELKLGDEAARHMIESRDLFEWQKNQELEMGILKNAIDEYMPLAFKVDPKKDQTDVIKNISNKFSEDPNFTFERFFANTAEGVAAGLQPDMSFFNRVKHRGLGHTLAVEEKKFLERMSFEYGIPTGTKEAIKGIMQGEDAKQSEAILDLMRQWDVDIGEEVAIKKAAEMERVLAGEMGSYESLAGLDKDQMPTLKHPVTKAVITPEQYQEMKQALYAIQEYPQLADPISGNTGIMKLRGVAKEMNLSFSPKEEEMVMRVGEAFKAHKDRQLGRAGEEIFARGATSTLPDNLRKSILNKLPSDLDRQFFGGVLPRGIVNMIEESKNNRDVLKAAIKNSSVIKDPEFKKAAEGMVDGYTGWLKMLRMWSTLPWAAFHARNMFSAQSMIVQEASALGEAFNLGKLSRNFNLRKGVGSIIQPDGTTLPARQMIKEMVDYGVINENPRNAIDIVDNMSSLFGRFTDKAKPLKWYNDKMMDVSGLVENYGREHLFISLREKGMDALTAANATNEVMVNYARGKTPFERDVMNRIMFFYSFARANTVNQVVSMFTKPGNITAQIYASEAARQVLLDPEATPLPKSLEEEINTSRGQEGFGRFVGRNEENGNPLIMTGVGMPIEDVARYFRFKTPNSANPQDILEAGLQTLQGTGKTIISQTNPMINQVIQLVTGKNYFFDREINDKSMRKVAIIAEDWSKIGDTQVVPKAVWKTLNEVTRTFLNGTDNGDGTMIVSPQRLAIAAMVVPGWERYRSTVGALSKDGVPTGAKVLRGLTGVKTTEVDVEKSLIFDERKRLEEFAAQKNLVTSKKKLRDKQREEMLRTLN